MTPRHALKLFFKIRNGKFQRAGPASFAFEEVIGTRHRRLARSHKLGEHHPLAKAGQGIDEPHLTLVNECVCACLKDVEQDAAVHFFLDRFPIAFSGCLCISLDPASWVERSAQGVASERCD